LTPVQRLDSTGNGTDHNACRAADGADGCSVFGGHQDTDFRADHGAITVSAEPPIAPRESGPHGSRPSGRRLA